MENVNNPDPYALVLADLRAKRLQIDQAIAAIEGLQTGVVAMGVGSSTAHVHAQAVSASPTTSGSLLGMSIAEAARKVLLTRHSTMTTPEIVAKLEQGGVVLTSVDKNNTVGSLLLRRFYTNGDIVRVNRGVWGLQEWYPGRKFAKGSKVGEEREIVLNKELSLNVGPEQEGINSDLSDFPPQSFAQGDES